MTILDDLAVVEAGLRDYAQQHRDDAPSDWPGDVNQPPGSHWVPNIMGNMKMAGKLISRRKLTSQWSQIFLETLRTMGVSNPSAAIKWIDDNTGTSMIDPFMNIVKYMSNPSTSEGARAAEKLVEQLFGPPLLLTEEFGGPVKDITRVGIEDERDQVTEKPRNGLFWSDYKQKRTVK